MEALKIQHKLNVSNVLIVSGALAIQHVIVAALEMSVGRLKLNASVAVIVSGEEHSPHQQRTVLTVAAPNLYQKQHEKSAINVLIGFGVLVIQHVIAVTLEM